MSTRRGPGERAGLDTAQVVTAARAVLEEDGVTAFSLRAVARRLGVAPNALYSHVASRDDLVDAVLDDVLGDVALPAEALLRHNPAQAVRVLMLDCYDALLRHPGLMPSYLERQGARGVQAQRLGVVTMDALQRCGLDERAAREAMSVLIVHTIGFAAFSAPTAGSTEGLITARELRRTFEQGLDWLLTSAAPERARRSSL